MVNSNVYVGDINMKKTDRCSKTIIIIVSVAEEYN